MAFFMLIEQTFLNLYGDTKDPKYQRNLKNKEIKLEDIVSVISGYTIKTKLQSSKQYSTGKKIKKDILISGAQQEAQK